MHVYAVRSFLYLLGCGPIACSWLICTSPNNTEPSRTAPIGTPRIASPPIFLSIFDTPSRELNCVINRKCTGISVDRAIRISFQRISINITCDRTAGIDLGHDIAISRNASVLINSNNGIFGHGRARVGGGITVAACILGCAVVILRLIGLACDFRDAVLSDPFESCPGIPPLTRSSITTIDQSLNRGNAISPPTFDFNSIRKR